jgi:serine/threonine protein kinase
MTISAGSHLGSYKILSPLGAGGMGAVWRARDTRLARDVAIKVLPAEFADQAERLARFEREARLLAALNHPNVAAIYGLEVFEGAPHLVLECVEGETLAERLAAGALPASEALSICRQIALALEAAHEAGVIHRDLKPGNGRSGPTARSRCSTSAWPSSSSQSRNAATFRNRRRSRRAERARA